VTGEEVGVLSAGLIVAQQEVPESFFGDRTGTTCIEQNKLFCPDWAVHNLDRYVDPTLQHLVLVVVPVLAGFVIAFGLALVSYRRRWLVPPVLGATGVLYTIPSLAFFFLLLPLTGIGRDTAIIALTAYTLQIIFRNIVAGLHNVDEDVKDAGRGMGLTPRQVLWKIEVPLATPEIIAGLRIATVSTVALATLATFIVGGGLGTQMVTGSNINFPTGIVIAGTIVMLMAFAFDALLLLVQRLSAPWRRVGPV
jgi:osmoprotectant transport system permease protein